MSPFLGIVLAALATPAPSEPSTSLVSPASTPAGAPAPAREAPRGASADVLDESAYYAVDHLVAPDGAILEVGGLGFRPDGSLVASTRRGQVWIVDEPLARDPRAARFRLFAEGLQEGLGLAVDGEDVLVLQRAELSRLSDADHDGRCDTIRTISRGWGVSGNYHEFAFGLPRDASGNAYVALNLGFTEPKWWHGRSLAPWRGWVLRIAPDGSATPFASGFRSPCGIGTNAAGEIFVTDNQGDWMPACPLEHVQEGRFYGAPASLAWTDAYRASRTEPSLVNPVDVPRARPACWIPYGWSRSTGDMRPAPADGSFGPFEDQLILAELTNGLVLRADLERVRGEYQGAVFLLRRDVGSAIRGLFARDGTLFLGLTNRGWGGLAPGHGIARVRWTGRRPFEVRHVRARPDGFELELTEPLAAGLELAPSNVSLSAYHYDWWWEYGSPERSDGDVPVARVETSSDRTRVRLVAPIEPGHCVRAVLKGWRGASGAPLLHDEFVYTLNELPEGPLATKPIARVAPPPPPRASQEEGWLRLTWGDALDLWSGRDTWRLVDAELDATDRTRLVTRPGNGALVNVGPAREPLESRVRFGDARVRLAFLLPEGGATRVVVHGAYVLRLSTDVTCGAVLGTDGSSVVPSAIRVAPVAGQWHELEFDVRAPRVDASGARVEPAHLADVTLDGTRIHERVDLVAPLVHGVEAEQGTLAIQGDLGPCAVGNLRVRAVRHGRIEGARALLPEDDTSGWRAVGVATWARDEGELTSGGAPGVLISDDVVRDATWHARVRVASGTRAAVWVRARVAADDGHALRGVCVFLNADHPDPRRTGSVLVVPPGSADATAPREFPRTVGLVGESSWCDLDVVTTDLTDGRALTLVVVRLNGVEIARHEVAGLFGVDGSIAFEQLQDGGVFQVGDVERSDASAR